MKKVSIIHPAYLGDPEKFQRMPVEVKPVSLPGFTEFSFGIGKSCADNAEKLWSVYELSTGTCIGFRGLSWKTQKAAIASALDVLTRMGPEKTRQAIQRTLLKLKEAQKA